MANRTPRDTKIAPPDPKIDFYKMKEDPDLWEALIEEEVRLSLLDPVRLEVVRAMYWDPDRSQAFQRFYKSLDFRQILQLMDILGCARDRPLCEVGGGSGQFAWSLAKSAYRNVELLEPNTRWTTGTAYLQTQLDQFKGVLSISNDLQAWYAEEKLFATVVTRNCIHHFPNIAMAASSIRQKLEKDGTWIAIREWFADTPSEMKKLILDHPYCQKYGVYEFPFPSKIYIDSIEYAGFKLTAIVPLGWGNNNLAGLCSNEKGSTTNQILSRFFLWLLKHCAFITAALYRIERFANKVLGTRFRCFTRPQVMVFKRVEVHDWPAASEGITCA